MPVTDLITLGAEKIQLLILLMVRVGGIMLTAPVFSHRTIPKRIVIGMSLGLSVVLLPLFIDTPLPQTNGIIELIILCLREAFCGVLLGMVFTMIFLGVRLAGSIVGYQIGFAMVNVIDPNSATQVSILGELWFLIATLVFLMLNGHHYIITGLVDSFRVLPLGLPAPGGQVGEWFIRYSSFVFVLAVKLAAPVMITIFLIEVTMGILARTMPQMNIFIVGFPLKIFVGLLIIGISLPAFGYILRKIIDGLDTQLAYLMSIYHVNGVT